MHAVKLCVASARILGRLFQKLVYRKPNEIANNSRVVDSMDKEFAKLCNQVLHPESVLVSS